MFDLTGRTAVVTAALPGAGKLGRQTETLGATFEPHQVNGQPGIIFRGPHGGIFSVMSIEVVDGRVATIRSVVNPDKLGHLGQVESLREVMEAAKS